MAAHLRTRSLVDKVFISPYCKSSEPIENRDHKEDVIGSYADGNAQGMLDMLKKTRNNVVIVIIDYAGLTTDPDDLLLFISPFFRNYQQIEQIFVDRLPITYEVEKYTRQQLLQDENCIQKFDCRSKPVQRARS
ncbi:hypothetical protein INT45_005789 [Circinella minor]|uniref:Uncharacterized protein n=1 Tax=Circinella minor TaxID=1195481 RepID=A0A8H7VTT3_9FUNG|nr:hypothetical protein INT45_005789 [Circinella minor]